MKFEETKKRGFAVIAVLFIIAALTLMFGMLIQLGGQRAHTARRLANQLKATAYAEAGIDYIYSIISEDFEQRNNSDLNAETTYAEGSYTITLTSVSNKYVIINSLGKCGNAERVAEILVDDENAGTTPTWGDYSSLEGFDYALLSGGTFNFGGSGIVSGLKMHSNSDIKINGDAQSDLDITSSGEIDVGNVTINGSLTAPEVDVHKNATVTGGYTEESVPPVAVPDIDLTPYRIWAQSKGEVRTGSVTINSSYTANGGIIWVDGDVSISGNITINATIIATGDIHISGNVDLTASSANIALASRNGDIKNTSSGEVDGLIYAKSGDYSQTANGTLNGQVLVNGSVKKGGESDIINYVQSIPQPPDGAVAPTPSWPVVSAWQK